MILTPVEYHEFLKTHLDLLFYVGKHTKVLPANTTFKKFLNMRFQKKFVCRNGLWEHGDLLDEYLASNWDHLTPDQIAILTGFKKRVRSNFVIFKCLKNHAIFLDTKDNNFYAVKALGDPFDLFFDRFPVNVSTTILPFRDKIIYDGFIEPSGVYYGRNVTASITDEYRKAKQENAIITRLDK